MSESKTERLRRRLTIDPDQPPPLPPPRASGAGERPAPPAAAIEPRVSALEDPAIVEGRNGYRSFYVDDGVFARFRAAIYWLSRREDAYQEVPENMSAAIEKFMRETADDLEQRFNSGAVFRATPDQLKSSRRRARRSTAG